MAGGGCVTRWNIRTHAETHAKPFTKSERSLTSDAVKLVGPEIKEITA